MYEILNEATPSSPWRFEATSLHHGARAEEQQRFRLSPWHSKHGPLYFFQLNEATPFITMALRNNNKCLLPPWHFDTMARGRTYDGTRRAILYESKGQSKERPTSPPEEQRWQLARQNIRGACLVRRGAIDAPRTQSNIRWHKPCHILPTRGTCTNGGAIDTLPVPRTEQSSRSATESSRHQGTVIDTRMAARSQYPLQHGVARTVPYFAIAMGTCSIQYFASIGTSPSKLYSIPLASRSSTGSWPEGRGGSKEMSTKREPLWAVGMATRGEGATLQALATTTHSSIQGKAASL